MLSAGGQFVMGLVILFVSSGLVAMAATHPTLPVVIAAFVIAPPGLWYGIFRWKRWLGQASCIYKLLTSLGEDAGDYLESCKQKQFQKARERANRGKL
ncbi:MAG: hypothetical protein AAGA55_08155 [Planctomycetota bacterium]